MGVRRDEDFQDTYNGIGGLPTVEWMRSKFNDRTGLVLAHFRDMSYVRLP